MANISGGTGADVLSGTSASDRFTGNAGADSFVFAPTAGGFGNDSITDLEKGVDKIDLTGFTAITGLSSLQITAGVGNTFVITVPGATGGTITVANPGNRLTLSDVQNSILFSAAPCFVRGTLIRTPQGDVAVESLSIGDQVETIDGVARSVKWIGRRSFNGVFLRRNAAAAPIEISAGAFGAAPQRPLMVSPDHAIRVGDVLVPARHLVDGIRLRQRADLEQVEYFHLEFDSGEVIYAEGLEAESFVSCENRRQFANAQEYFDLYGEQEPLSSRRLPLVEAGEALARIRADLGLAGQRVA